MKRPVLVVVLLIVLFISLTMLLQAERLFMLDVHLCDGQETGFCHIKRDADSASIQLGKMTLWYVVKARYSEALGVNVFYI